MLFQPSNIYPSTFSGIGAGTVDVTQGINVSWQVNGDTPMTAYQIKIYQNDSGSTLMYDSGSVSVSPVFEPHDKNGNATYFTAIISAAALSTAGIVNGYQYGYKMLITQWWGVSDYVEQTSASVFITRSTPTLAINTITTPVASNSLTITANYSQAQGDPISTVEWVFALAGSESTPIRETGAISTQVLSFDADGLITGNNYSIMCKVVTSTGMEASTGFVQFPVSYSSSSLGINYQLAQLKNSSAVYLSWDDLGSNILSYPYTDTTKTTNGITFTVNGEGDVVVTGTATADAYFTIAQGTLSQLGITAGQKFIVTSGYSGAKIVVTETNSSNVVVSTITGNDPLQYIATSTTNTMKFSIVIPSGSVLSSGQQLKPMIALEDKIVAFNDVSANIEPIQDLHGYDSPWVGTEQDKVPYNFRALPDPDTTEIGNSEIGKIVGGTVAWNQLRPDSIASGTSQGIVLTFDSETGEVELSGTSTTTYRNFFSRGPLTLNHKYALIMDVLKNPNNVSFHLNAFNAVTTGTFSNPSTIAMCRLERETTNIGIEGFTANTVMDGIVLKFNIFDLTAMFGSTIADYIYSLEQNTAGAGVAWFRKLFPKPYYAYDAGSLLSVKTTAHKEVGFNQWDEEWEEGNIDTSTGQNTIVGTRIRSKNYIPVIPNTTYAGFFKQWSTGTVPSTHSHILCYYDAEKNFISGGWTSNGLFTTPSNACYIRFATNDVYGTTYNHDICINLHWDGERDGEYEPYEANTYALDDVELRGIPKLDASNNLYYDGDSYAPDGTVTRRYGIKVFDGSETWFWSTTNALGQIAVPNGIITNASTQYSAYTFNSNPTFRDSSWVARNTEKPTIGMFYGSSFLFAKSDDFSSAQDVKDYFTAHPTTVIYELATPTTESADPYTSPQSVSPYGTEEYVDAGVAAGTRDVAIPVGHETTFANICPISGRTGVSVYVSPTQDVADATTYAIDWTSEAGTVYGGTVDVVTGLLTVDWAMVDMGTLTWSYANSIFVATLPSDSYKYASSVNAISDCYAFVGTIQNGTFDMQGKADCSFALYYNANYPTSRVVYVKNTAYTDSAAFKTAMDGHQLVYELATPLTYQLTAQEIEALVGTNNVWSTGDSVSVTYTKDTGSQATLSGAIVTFSDSNAVLIPTPQYIPGITGISIYRYLQGESALQHVYDLATGATSILDYYAPSQMQVSYLIVAHSGIGDLFLQTTKFTPTFWFFSILLCDTDSNGVYHVSKEYIFKYGVETGAVSNNNDPTIQKNFTPYPNRQPISTLYKTGKISGYIGKTNNLNRYSDSISLQNAIYDISVSSLDKFLKSRKGDVIKVDTASSIQMKTEDNTVQQALKATVDWVEVGEASNKSIVSVPTDSFWPIS